MSPAGIAIRTCIGCRKRRPKTELIRIARGRDGLKIDPSGREAGRGAYLCAKDACLEAALKRAGLNRALRTKIADRELEEIRTGVRKLLNEQKVS